MKKCRLKKGGLLWWINEIWFFLLFVVLASVFFLRACEATEADTQAEPIEYTAPIEEKEQLVYMGEFTVTAYCPCEICCGEWSNKENPITASGTVAKEGRTVGADWDTLPSGTSIVIDGVGERIVEDMGAEWISERYNGRYIDIYFDSHEDALKFGKRTVDVWRVVNE